MSILLDNKENERLRRLVGEAYPNRAPSIIDKIVEHARYLHWPSKSDAENIEAIKSIERTKGAEFTRPTPSPADYVRFIEAERTAKGIATDGEARMHALRKAQSMTPDELVNAIPASFELAQPVEAPAAAPAFGDALDRKIEYAFGIPAGQINSLAPSKVRDYRKAFAEADAPKTHTIETPVGRELTAAEKMAAFRREQAAKS